jgi:hypothetical protein
VRVITREFSQCATLLLMIGRLIIALLVICSAGAVMWQRQQAEASDVSATLSEDKVDDANKKVTALEEKLAQAEARAAATEARNKYLEGEIEKLSTDCTPVSDDDEAMSIGTFKFRNVKDGKGNFTLILGGGPEEIVRMRVIGSPPWDPSQRVFIWDTMNADESWRAVLTRNGKPVPLDDARNLALDKQAGAMLLNVALTDSGNFVNGAIFELEIISTNGERLTARTVLGSKS